MLQVAPSTYYAATQRPPSARSRTDAATTEAIARVHQDNFGATGVRKVHAELIRNRGPWRSIGELEIAVAEYVDWFNHRRLHGEIGMVPPAEFETEFCQNNPESASADALAPSLQ